MLCLSKISVFIRKDHRTKQDLLIGTMIQIKLDPVCDLFHSFSENMILIEDTQGFVCGVTLKNGSGACKIPSCTDGIGTKYLHTCICTV